MFLTLLVSLVVGKLQAYKGYTKFTLNNDEEIQISVGRGYQAFIYGSGDFFQSSVVRIIDGKQYQDVKTELLSSSRGIAVLGDTIHIYYSHQTTTNVEIWVIYDKSCMNQAFLIESNGAYEFSVDPNELYSRTCVFPVGGKSDRVSFGFPSEVGVSKIVKQYGSQECFHQMCEINNPGPFYASFEDGHFDFHLNGYSKNTKKSVCSQHNFIYLNISAVGYPKFTQPKIHLTCNDGINNEQNSGYRNENKNENLYKNNENNYKNADNYKEKNKKKDSSFFLWVSVVAICSMILIAIISSCNCNHHHRPHHQIPQPNPGFQHAPNPGYPNIPNPYENLPHFHNPTFPPPPPTFGAHIHTHHHIPQAPTFVFHDTTDHYHDRNDEIRRREEVRRREEEVRLREEEVRRREHNENSRFTNSSNRSSSPPQAKPSNTTKSPKTPPPPPGLSPAGPIQVIGSAPKRQ